MFGKLKKFTGLFLVLLAILLLAAWETKGRDLVLMNEVMVARSDIPAGEALESAMLRTVSVPGNALIEDAVTPDLLLKAEGMVVTDRIPAGGQLSARLLKQDLNTQNDDSFFVLGRAWILMRSSALRRGDEVEIVSADGIQNFGRYKIAFVKDDEDREIQDLANSLLSPANKAKDRINGSAKVDHIEISCELEAYLRMKRYAEENTGPSLILIRRDA